MLTLRLTASMNTSNSSEEDTLSNFTQPKRVESGRTKTTDRAANGLPQRQQQTYCGERLLAATEGGRVFLPVDIVPSLCSLRAKLFVGLHLQLQGPCDMVKENFAEVTTAREMVGEVNLAAQSNMTTEVVPSSQTRFDRLAQRLVRWVVSAAAYTIHAQRMYLVQRMHRPQVAPG